MSKRRLKPGVWSGRTPQPDDGYGGTARRGRPAAKVDRSTPPLEGDSDRGTRTARSRTRLDAPDHERNRIVQEEFVEWITGFRLPWTVFLSLTYAGDPPDRDRAETDAYRFVKRVDRALSFAPPYVGCIEGEPSALGEVGRSSRTNIHILLAGVAATELGRLADLWLAGMTRAQPARTDHVGYVTKDLPSDAIFLIPGDFRHRVHELRRWEALQRKRAGRWGT